MRAPATAAPAAGTSAWPEGSQDSARPGKDNPYRWDGDGDYRSLGCIKLSPAHIKNLFAKAERSGWPTKLKVTS